MIRKAPADDADKNLPPVGSVYIVEDEAIQRFALKGILENAGFDVTSFDSAEDFLDSVAQLSGGCVITDLNMPGMSGLDLQKVLLDRWGDFRVILMSAGIDTKSRTRAVNAGAIAVLDKLTWYDVIDPTVRKALRELETAGASPSI